MLTVGGAQLSDYTHSLCNAPPADIMKDSLSAAILSFTIGSMQSPPELPMALPSRTRSNGQPSWRMTSSGWSRAGVIQYFKHHRAPNGQKWYTVRSATTPRWSSGTSYGCRLRESPHRSCPCIQRQLCFYSLLKMNSNL